MPSSTLRRNPSRYVKEAATKVAKRSNHPASPVHAKTTNASSAPAMPPDSETARSRQASHAMITLTPRAGARASATPGHADYHASPDTRFAHHSTAAAATGTLMLSSSLTGMVSTSAGGRGATTGATRPNASGGNGCDGRAYPKRQQNASHRSGNKEHDRTGDRFVTVPGEGAAAHGVADQRCASVAHREHAPCGSSNVRSPWERDDEQ